MRTCPQCQAENPDGVAKCSQCGEALETATAGPPPLLTDADFDPEEERERFEQRYGIDVGDRTVDEYLQHLSRRDFSLTAWVGVIAVTEIVGVTLFTFELVVGTPRTVDFTLAYPAISILLSLGIVADTRSVGQFGSRAKIRWTYVAFAAIPLVGHIAGFLYLVLRRLMHQETVEHRRRLLDAGFDLSVHE